MGGIRREQRSGQPAEGFDRRRMRVEQLLPRDGRERQGKFNHRIRREVRDTKWMCLMFKKTACQQRPSRSK